MMTVRVLFAIVLFALCVVVTFFPSPLFLAALAASIAVNFFLLVTLPEKQK